MSGPWPFLRKCVWASIRPGTTVRPSRSIVSVQGSIVSGSPTSRMRPSRTRTASASVSVTFIVRTRPFTSSRSLPRGQTGLSSPLPPPHAAATIRASIALIPAIPPHRRIPGIIRTRGPRTAWNRDKFTHRRHMACLIACRDCTTSHKRLVFFESSAGHRSSPSSVSGRTPASTRRCGTLSRSFPRARPGRFWRPERKTTSARTAFAWPPPCSYFETSCSAELQFRDPQDRLSALPPMGYNDGFPSLR